MTTLTLTLPDWDSMRLVMPEVWLVLGMCAVILVPFFKRDSVLLPVLAALGALLLALLAVLWSLPLADRLVFSNMLAIDPFSQFFKVLLLAFTALVVVQWLMTSRNATSPYDVPDFLCLLLGATVGMALMVSASNLLMIFIAIESASLPSFALAGFRKRSRLSTEGSLKYVLFGAASSAVSLYGMSLIYGSVGSLDLPTIAHRAAYGDQTLQLAAGVNPLLAVGLLAMFAGFAFKLSAVPLHFWCPDVFEGAPIEVTTFLSVASKGAAVCLLLRVLMTFGAAAPLGSDLFLGLAVGVAVLGALTALWGNLVALHQTNLKRLLAYSSISHAGYMIMGCSLIVTAGRYPNSALTPSVVAGAVLFYLLVYTFMNLGAFTVAGLVAQQAGTEDIREYAGLVGRSPLLSVLLSIFLLSLFGMPGLGGFMGKFVLGAAMAKAGPAGFALIAVLLINTLISLYYYLRPVYYMVLVRDEQQRPVVVPQLAGVLLLIFCAAALLWTGLIPERANRTARDFSTMRVHQAAPAPAPSSTEHRTAQRLEAILP